MSATVLSALSIIGASLVTLAGVVYTTHVARVAQRRSEQLEHDKVDAAAYQRARDSYEAAIVRLNDEITRLDRQVKQLREALDMEQGDNHALRRTLRHIEDTISQLHELLRRAGVEIPPEMWALPSGRAIEPKPKA